MNKTIEHIRECYSKLKNSQELKEENVKIKIVRDIFLSELGYDVDNCNYEDWRNPGSCDICVKVSRDETGDKDEYLAIETKKGDKPLESKDIHQLVNYMNGKETWGILTNGIVYVLINNRIDNSLANIELTRDQAQLSKVVFWFDLSKKRNHELKYFQYLSKENLFINKNTTYFYYIEQLKTSEFINKPNSWKDYKSTLFQFFDYYSQAKGKFRELSRIDTDDFKEFIQLKKKANSGLPKTVSSAESIKNNFSHLNKLFTTLKVNNESFSKGREKILKDFEGTETIKNINYLNLDNINKIITYLKTKETAARDIAVFVLCAYIGLERPKICNLKWSDIDLNNKILLVDGRKIPMCSILSYAFERIGDICKRNKIKSEYVFMANHLGKWNPCQEGTINWIFSTFVGIDSDTKKWKMFSPQYIRNNLPIVLSKSGMYLDEIMYLTGIDIKNLRNYIPDEQIIELQSKEQILSDRWRSSQKRIKAHPFDEAFNKESYDF